MAQDDFSTGTVELEETEVKVDRPPLFTVVIFNDDFTPMEFVVYVIQKFFGYDHAKSTEIMLEIHNKGRGCLLYTSPSPRDLAQSRMPSSA